MSITWKVHLEFEEDSSSKFWRARTEGKTLFVNYGRIGTTGQMSMKELASPDAAQKELEKLEREKRKKGYQDSGSAGSSDGESAAEEEDEDEAEEEDEDEKPKKGKAKAAPAAAAAPAAPSAVSVRLALSGKGRSIQTRLSLEGNKLRVEADESYDSAESAKAAFERIKQALEGEGYKESK